MITKVILKEECFDDIQNAIFLAKENIFTTEEICGLIQWIFENRSWKE
jgi:hypothetical protein